MRSMDYYAEQEAKARAVLQRAASGQEDIMSAALNAVELLGYDDGPSMSEARELAKILRELPEGFRRHMAGAMSDFARRNAESGYALIVAGVMMLALEWATQDPGEPVVVY